MPVHVASEYRKITCRGQPAAMRVHSAYVQVVRILPASAVIDHLPWRALAARVPGDAHACHAATVQNGVAYVLLVHHLGQLLDHASQDAEPEVGIGEVFPRRMS